MLDPPTPVAPLVVEVVEREVRAEKASLREVVGFELDGGRLEREVSNDAIDIASEEDVGIEVEVDDEPSRWELSAKPSSVSNVVADDADWNTSMIAAR